MKLTRAQFLALTRLGIDGLASLTRREQFPIIDDEIADEFGLVSGYSVEEAVLTSMALYLGGSPDGMTMERGRSSVVARAAAPEVLRRFREVIQSGETFRRAPNAPVFFAGAIDLVASSGKKLEQSRIGFCASQADIGRQAASFGHAVMSVSSMNITATAAVTIARAARAGVDLVSYWDAVNG